MPFVNVNTNVVSVLDGKLKVIGKLIGLASVLLASPMVTTGNGLISVIVPVATIGVLLLVVLPEVTVPVKVKVSGPSDIPSVLVGTLTVAVNDPAGIVTVVVTLV